MLLAPTPHFPALPSCIYPTKMRRHRALLELEEVEVVEVAAAVMELELIGVLAL